jgi:hypothetical protein
MSLLRERARPGLGIIEPCLPSPAKAPPSGPGLLHEIKRRPSRDAANQRARRVVQLPGRRADASRHHQKLTADERDELFRKFQRWRSTHE